MAIFKKKDKDELATAPEEPESKEEIEHIEELSKTNKKPKEEEQYREIPICLSQTQINNLVIENNMMLKQIMLEINR